MRRQLRRLVQQQWRVPANVSVLFYHWKRKGVSGQSVRCSADSRDKRDTVCRTVPAKCALVQRDVRRESLLWRGELRAAQILRGRRVQGLVRRLRRQ